MPDVLNSKNLRFRDQIRSSLSSRARAQKLFDDSKRLAPFVLNKTFPDLSAGEKDEFLTVAYLGLWSAAQRFEPSLNNRFASYAVSMIRGYLLHEYRRLKKAERLSCFSLDAPLGEDVSYLNKLAAPCQTSDPFVMIAHQERLEKARAKWENASDHQRGRHPAVYAEADALFHRQSAPCEANK